MLKGLVPPDVAAALEAHGIRTGEDGNLAACVLHLECVPLSSWLKVDCTMLLCSC